LTYQDLQPRFLRELHQAGHEQLAELRAILEESFLQDEAGRWYVPDPVSSPWPSACRSGWCKRMPIC
jgi:hypothetical protein